MKFTLSLAMAALLTAPAMAAPIKIGMITTLSGGGAGLGVDTRDGFDLALKLAGDAASEITVVTSVGSDANRLSDELFALRQTVTANPDLRDALATPARSVADKSALIDALLEGKALPATIALAKQALGGTYRTLTAALESYREVAAEARGVLSRASATNASSSPRAIPSDTPAKPEA